MHGLVRSAGSRLVLGLAALALLSGATTNSMQSVPCNHADPLTIVAEDSQSPWSYPDGSGYANDLVRAAYLAAGVPMQLRVEPYARCKQNVIDGSAAGCFSMSAAPELEGRVMFSNAPLFVCYADYLYRADRPLEAKSEGTIRKKIVVGSVVGYEYPPSVARLQTAGLIELDPAGSELLSLKKLDAGRLDAALVNHNEIKTVEKMCAKAGVRHEIRVAFRSGELKSYIGFGARHPCGQWARERFDAGYATISKNGVLRALTEKWTRLAHAEPVAEPR